MTDATDILGRAPITRPAPQYSAGEQDLSEDWKGQHLIEAPKRNEPEPEPILSRKRLKTETRMAIVKKMHAEGKDTQDIMQATGSTRHTITGDLKALGLYVKPTQMRGNEDKARAAYAEYLKAHNMTAAEFTETNRGGLVRSQLRGDGLLFIRDKSGATPTMLEKITGLHRNTCNKAVKLARMRRDGK